MTRSTLLALGLLALFDAGASAAAERAIWTWEQASYAMLVDRAAGDAAIAFLRSKHVRTVYLYADAYQEQNLLEARPDLYRQLIRRLHARGLRASGQALAVGPAIPFWLDGIVLDWQGRTKPVSEQLIDLYDYVALMDYRDHAEGPDGIVSLGADEVEYANRRHKKVVIGVDFTPGEIQKTSFDHLVEADLERELERTERAFHGSPAFAGFALHHFEAYRRWLERDRY